jgi:hypothetical protein
MYIVSQNLYPERKRYFYSQMKMGYDKITDGFVSQQVNFHYVLGHHCKSRFSELFFLSLWGLSDANVFLLHIQVKNHHSLQVSVETRDTRN